MKKQVKNLTELEAVAGAFLKALSKMPPKDTATVIGLSGDLGAGKTAFTKCVAHLLGIKDTVTSPTFILEKIYEIPEGSILNKKFSKLVHIDAYRLEEGREMDALGWNGVLADRENLVLLEWPEQVSDALPQDIIRISFEFVSENVRKIETELI